MKAAVKSRVEVRIFLIRFRNSLFAYLAYFAVIHPIRVIGVHPWLQPQNPKIPHLKVTQFTPAPSKKASFPAKFLNSPYLSRYDARLHMGSARLIHKTL